MKKFLAGLMLVAFVTVSGMAYAQATGGTPGKTTETGKKGKTKSHSKKGGKKGKKSSGGTTTTPPPK